MRRRLERLSNLLDSGAVLGQHGAVHAVDVLDEVAHGVGVHGAERDGGRDLRTRGQHENTSVAAKEFFIFFFCCCE